MDESDTEHESLLPGSRFQRKKKNEGCCSSPSTGICVNRFLILLLLVGFVGVSVYYEDQLTAATETVHSLEKAVADHAEVIRRFNNSVTNADVVKQMKWLEDALNFTARDLEHSMIALQHKVDDQLNDTLNDLGATVQEAKDEIQRQVDHVKKDVEQYVLQTQDQFSMENSFMVYQLAGTLTLLSCLISMWHMTAHLRKMQQPVVQRKILAILWMSPIYAVTSWFSLVFHSAEGYLAIIKDGYEAYIIYQFLSFCIAVLGKGDRNKVVDLLVKRADHLTPPFQCCRCCDRTDPYENNPRALADAILLQCQVFCMQFVFLRPLTTIATVVLDKMEYYGAADNPHDYRAPQFYIVVIQNISVFTAFAGLLKFYHAVDKDLQWCRPFAKFLCIKGVVFMTFWQGLAISILAETTDVGGNQADEWGKSAQNFLICLEMLLFSIAHFYCFPTDEWNPDYKARASRGLAESLALGDFVQDLKLILKSGKKKKAKKKPATVPEEDENTVDETESPSVVSSAADLENNLREMRLSMGEESGDEEDDENVESAKERLRRLGIGRAQSGDSDFGPREEEEEEEEEEGYGRAQSGESDFGPREYEEDDQGEEGYGRAQSGESDLVPIEHEEEDQGEDGYGACDIPVATETTGLLESTRKSDSSSDDEEVRVPRTKNDEVLQPSIFTSFG